MEQWVLEELFDLKAEIHLTPDRLYNLLAHAYNQGYADGHKMGFAKGTYEQGESVFVSLGKAIVGMAIKEGK